MELVTAFYAVGYSWDIYLELLKQCKFHIFLVSECTSANQHFLLGVVHSEVNKFSSTLR